MKNICIFLASSLYDEPDARVEIENFIDSLNEKAERYQFHLQPVSARTMHGAMEEILEKTERDETIRQSEFCYFIFFGETEADVEDEFEVARKLYEKTSKPQIYTYFKLLPEADKPKHFAQFQQVLDRTLGHYYGQFEHIDTVKLRILLSLHLKELDFMEIKAEDGVCKVDGKELLPLSHVMEFANNRDLAKLQQQYQELEAQYLQMRSRYGKSDCDEAFYREYSRIASRRAAIQEEIEQLQALLFQTSLNLVKDATRGEITQRQKEAYRLFELGDYEGCLSVLNPKDIDEDFQSRRLRIQAEDLALCRNYIREYKTRIEILTTMTAFAGRFEEIDNCYQKIIPLALEQGIELDVVYDYAYYLDDRKPTRALDIATQLEHCYQTPGMSTEEDESILWNLMGKLHNALHHAEQAEAYYKKAIAIYERLAKEDPAQFEPYLATSYNNIGVFYNDQGNFQQSEIYYKKAIAIRERLAKEDPAQFESDLASSYNNVGVFYNNQGKPRKAESYYKKAIAIYERLVEENPAQFEPDLAGSYNNIGNLYSDQDKPRKAEENYKKAIAIRERLAKEDSAQFEPDLAASYNNIGAFYDEGGKFQFADENYKKAIAIRERLAKEDPAQFEPDLANSYNNIGVLYANPDYIKQDNSHQAELYCKKAIAIFERLAKENTERFKPVLAASYNNIGNLYFNQGNSRQAKSYYKKAIAIRERLVEESPAQFEPDLAVSYFNYGLFTGDVAYVKKALALAELHPENPSCRQILDILT